MSKSLIAVVSLLAAGCLNADSSPTEGASSRVGADESYFCVDESERGGATYCETPIERLAQARVLATAASGSGLQGWARLGRFGRSVVIRVDLEGCSPGDHGLHIHEVGACGRDGLLAGGHWNPLGLPHGEPASPGHRGDLGNITCDADGRGTAIRFVDSWTIGGARERDVLERAIIVHASVDDLGQPTGNAGARLGCGIISDASAIAEAAIVPASDAAVAGSVVFELRGSEVTAAARVTGCPEGVHGIHLHENGSCGNAGADAGGHWNPHGVEHGQVATGGHFGDLGNIVCNAAGTGYTDAFPQVWSMDGTAEESVLGHSVILHGGPDDLVSQPSGNAGARIGCGVVDLLFDARQAPPELDDTTDDWQTGATCLDANGMPEECPPTF